MQNKLLGDSSIEYFFSKPHKTLCIIEIYKEKNAGNVFFDPKQSKLKQKILHQSFTVLKTINVYIKN